MYLLQTTLLKKNFFLIYKEIQNGSGAKSFMMKGFLICGDSGEIRKYLVIYDEEAVSRR